MHSSNLLSNETSFFFPFPVLLSVTLTGASWDHLQSNLLVPESLEEANPDRSFRLSLLIVFYNFVAIFVDWGG